MSVSANNFRRAASNSTATSFTAQIPKTTAPDDVLLDNRADVPEYLILIPFGKDGNDDTFDFRVWGWNLEPGGYYVPQLLFAASVVLGNIAAGFAANTFLADTIAATFKGPADWDGAHENSPWATVVSNAGDLASYALISTFGCSHISFDYDRAGGQEGTECNCLWRPVDRTR